MGVKMVTEIRPSYGISEAISAKMTPPPIPQIYPFSFLHKTAGRKRGKLNHERYNPPKGFITVQFSAMRLLQDCSIGSLVVELASGPRVKCKTHLLGELNLKYQGETT